MQQTLKEDEIFRTKIMAGLGLILLSIISNQSAL